MAQCTFSPGSHELKCQICDSVDVELHYIGSCFDKSEARYIRCATCRVESFISGVHISDVPPERRVEPGPLVPLDPSTASCTNGQPIVGDIPRIRPDYRDDKVESFSMSYQVAPPPPSKRLRASSSSFDIDQSGRAETGFGRSASFNDFIAESSVDSDTIDQHVRLLIESLRQHPCSVCSRRKWQRVEGLDTILTCGNTACNNVIGFDNLISYYDDLLPFLRTGEYRAKKCLFCSNNDPEKFRLELFDEQIVLRCTAAGCGRRQNEIEVISADDKVQEGDTKKQFSGVSSGKCADGTDGRSCGRTEIKDIRVLQRGDHIAWHQSLSYWHHGLVQEVGDGRLRVVHYNGPIRDDLSSKIKGVIMQEWIKMDRNYLRDNKLYRWNYDAKDCLPSDIVIELALSRLGEKDYSLFSNNCEHFATWCKTGQKHSTQVEAFKETVKRHDSSWRIAEFFARVFQNRSSRDIKKAVRIGGKTANIVLNLTSAGNDVGKAATQTALNEVKHAASALKFLETGIVLVLEVGAVIRDVHRAHGQRKAGEITRDEFIRVTIKRTSEGVGCVAGAAVVLALPLPAKYIGCTLATLIGQGAGALVGKKLADLV